MRSRPMRKTTNVDMSQQTGSRVLPDVSPNVSTETDFAGLMSGLDNTDLSFMDNLPSLDGSPGNMGVGVGVGMAGTNNVQENGLPATASPVASEAVAGAMDNVKDMLPEEVSHWLGNILQLPSQAPNITNMLKLSDRFENEPDDDMLNAPETTTAAAHMMNRELGDGFPTIGGGDNTWVREPRLRPMLSRLGLPQDRHSQWGENLQNRFNFTGGNAPGNGRGPSQRRGRNPLSPRNPWSENGGAG